MKSRTILLLRLAKESWWVEYLVNILFLLIILINCFDKFWLFWSIVLSATCGSISITSFAAAVIGAPVGIASSSFSFVFSMAVGIL